MLFCTLKDVLSLYLLFLKFSTLLCWLHCQCEHAVLFFVYPTKQKSLLMKCAPEHALSVLKPNSVVLKWKPVVSVLSPLSLFSRGGSHVPRGVVTLNPG